MLRKPFVHSNRLGECSRGPKNERVPKILRRLSAAGRVKGLGERARDRPAHRSRVLDLVENSLERVEVLITRVCGVDNDMSVAGGVTGRRIGIRRPIDPPTRVRPRRALPPDRQLNVSDLMAPGARRHAGNPCAVRSVVLRPPAVPIHRQRKAERRRDALYRIGWRGQGITSEVQQLSFELEHLAVGVAPSGHRVTIEFDCRQPGLALLARRVRQ